MTLRFNQLVTHFEPDEALTVGNCSLHCSTSCIHALVIEFLDQLREVLMSTYGEQIEHMLKEASQPDATTPPPKPPS